MSAVEAIYDGVDRYLAERACQQLPANRPSFAMFRVGNELTRNEQVSGSSPLVGSPQSVQIRVASVPSPAGPHSAAAERNQGGENASATDCGYAVGTLNKIYRGKKQIIMFSNDYGVFTAT